MSGGGARRVPLRLQPRLDERRRVGHDAHAQQQRRADRVELDRVELVELDRVPVLRARHPPFNCAAAAAAAAAPYPSFVLRVVTGYCIYCTVHRTTRT